MAAMIRPTLSLAWAALLATAHASAGAAPDPRHSAACVAALQVRAKALGAQLREGHKEVEPVLLSVLERGFAFIGTAYLQGVSKASGDALLAEALKAQEKLTPAELSNRQAMCEAEGARLLDDANPLSRTLVAQAARKRVDKERARIKP
jgi:hypothetical protein